MPKKSFYLLLFSGLCEKEHWKISNVCIITLSEPHPHHLCLGKHLLEVEHLVADSHVALHGLARLLLEGLLQLTILVLNL